MIWWLMGFAVVIAAHAPQAFRARQEGTGGMNSMGGGGS